jgi:glyoxylase-like metal-dependent hydrolase (beta-lactamase superfamily II)
MEKHSGRHSHQHHHHPHPRNHVVDGPTSRRDFLRILMGGALAGASILELAWHRAAWARAAALSSDPNLFDIQKVANGVYFARARPQAMLNCNAAIFVRSKDVVVVDAHSKPSAAASLIGQMKREVTTKPVRYVINTHFHTDHTQGDHAYRLTGEKVDFIASAATGQLMASLAVDRMKASVGGVPQQIDAFRHQAAHATSAGEKAFCADQIRQLQAYQAELKDFAPELPTITFDKSYLLQDPDQDLHLEFHGHAHTAGDVVVYCPQARAVATGDVIHGFLPNIADGFPRIWPGTIDSIGTADFNTILPGHAALQTGRMRMINQRNYIEELTGNVEQGKKAGLTLAEMQQRITVASLKSLHSNGYQEYLARMSGLSNSPFSKPTPLQSDVNENIAQIYDNLDRT